VAQSGSALDPVKIAAFGTDWYLLDGHHRLRAYQEAGWSSPVPVEVLQSDLSGAARINWAIQQSNFDNKKNRLSMSDVDKMDAAWASVARQDDLSIRHTAELFGISHRSVATMRSTAQALRDGDVSLGNVHSWSQAKRDLRRLASGGELENGDFDFERKRRRLAARQLKGVMQMNLPPRLLAEVLESFSPGLVDSMALALKIIREDDGGEDM
jgi:hypothetical protein